MKVVCIDNTSGNARHLDLWVVYDAVQDSLNGFSDIDYYIIKAKPYLKPHLRQDRSQIEQEIWIDKKVFITLEEWRKRQLETIGI